MWVFGHAGITAWAVDAVDEREDLRAPMALALAPDVIDKPMSFFLPSILRGNTRGFGHTLIAVAAALVLLLALKRPVRRAFLWWACYAGHLVLDRMWLAEGPIIALWPFLGPFPPLTPFVHTPNLLAYNVIGEVVGACLLWSVALRRSRSDWLSASASDRRT